jgi:glycosidase
MHQVYELNARTWRTERSLELGRPANLDDLDYSFLDHLVESGFTWLYLTSVWPSGPLVRAWALADRDLRAQLGAVLNDFTDNDIAGSPTAIAGYTVKPELGGDDALDRLRHRARTSGLSLMLDFIPNQVGLDHPWAVSDPQHLIQGTENDLRQAPQSWIKLGEYIFAHGRDPNFPAWRDTLQIDFSRPATQEAVIRAASTVAARCDGLRCEEAMLLLPCLLYTSPSPRGH